MAQEPIKPVQTHEQILEMNAVLKQDCSSKFL